MNFTNVTWQSGLFILLPNNGSFPDLTDPVAKHLMDASGIPFAAAGKRTVLITPANYGSGGSDHSYILYNVYSAIQPVSPGVQTIRIS